MEFHNEYKEYEHKLNDEEKKFIQKFYKEHYCADFYTEGENILEGEARKEAHRNKNVMNRDALPVAKTYDLLDNIEVTEQYYVQKAAEKWEWQNVYKVLGYEAAVKKIVEHALNDLDNEELDKSVTLIRFYSQMCELNKINKRRKKQK